MSGNASGHRVPEKPAADSGPPLEREVPAVAVVGWKHTGKTTLVARLTAALQAEGYRVGTCKHDGAHELQSGDEGTDTWKHRQAGAQVTLAVSREMAVLHEVYAEEPPLADWVGRLQDPRFGLDVILVEGWKHSPLPKFVLIGTDAPSESIGEQLSNVLGFVRNGTGAFLDTREVPVYDREDIQAIVDRIKRCVLREPPATL